MYNINGFGGSGVSIISKKGGSNMGEVCFIIRAAELKLELLVCE